MKTEIIYEKPILTLKAYTGCNDDCCGMNCQDESVYIYLDELKAAKIGTVWSVEDVDRCPNASERWTKSLTKIFENTEGIAVVFTSESASEEEKIYWIKKTSR